MTLQEKYSLWQPKFQNGDIVNVVGTKAISKIIAWSDRKKGEDQIATHSFLCTIGNFDGQVRRFAIQAEAQGVIPAFLSDAILSDVKDFYILRPTNAKAAIDNAVQVAYEAADKGISYDFKALPKILVYEKLGMRSKIMSGFPNEQICSVFTGRQYASQLVNCYDAQLKERGFLTPADLRRYAVSDQITILATEAVI